MKRKLLYVSIVAVCVLLFVLAEDTAQAARYALFLCAQTVIPALFPFFVLSSFMVSTGFVSALGRVLSPVSKTLFRVSGSGAVVFVVGLLCGYPTGAKTVAELYENKQMERQEAERLLPFCNNSGPLFVIGAVGGMLGCPTLGGWLYVIHAVSAVCTGVFLSFFAKSVSSANSSVIHSVNIGAVFSDAVCRSVTAILQVCGFVVFFSVIRTFFAPFLGTDALSLLLGGMAEVTLGAEAICVADVGINQQMILLSAVLGFGGLCVFLQVWGIVSRAGLSVKWYLFGKLVQSGVAAIAAFFFTEYLEITPVFAAGFLPARTSLLPFFCACGYALFCAFKLTKVPQKHIIEKD